MRLARWLVLLCAATAWQAAAQTWDTSGNVCSTERTTFGGGLLHQHQHRGAQPGIALYGNISFNAAGPTASIVW